MLASPPHLCSTCPRAPAHPPKACIRVQIPWEPSALMESSSGAGVHKQQNGTGHYGGSALLPQGDAGGAHLTEECPLKLPGMPTACQDGVGILSPVPSSACNTSLHPQLGSRPVFPAGIEPPGAQGFPKASLPSHRAHRHSTVPTDGEPPTRKLLGRTQSWDQLQT